jgi:hypothetical protein
MFTKRRPGLLISILLTLPATSCVTGSGNNAVCVTLAAPLDALGDAALVDSGPKSIVAVANAVAVYDEVCH